MKLCICDLDGVVADNTERFKRAEEAKQKFLADFQTDHAKRMDFILSGKRPEKAANDLYWSTAFTPQLVALDTIIPGAKEALETLRFKRGYEIMFLSSRPMGMRLATERWLFENDVLFFFSMGGPLGRTALMMKAPGFQYVKTVTWKAGMIWTLAGLYGTDEIMFIDDESANLEAAMDAWNEASPRPFLLGVYRSLQSAIDDAPYSRQDAMNGQDV